MKEAFYSIHGLLNVKVVGADSAIGRVLDSTLDPFRVQSLSYADIVINLGSLPSSDWAATGFTVGDKLLYDEDTSCVTIFKHPTVKRDSRQIEYIIRGDFRNGVSPVFVFMPNLPSKIDPFAVIIRALRRRNFSRLFLFLLGASYPAEEDIELEAAKLRLAVLEPFLYYRLPTKGATLVHGSVVEREGKGLLIAGTGHIGKTSLSLYFAGKGLLYLGDDLTIVNSQGFALAYPEPVRVQEQHLDLIPNLEDKLLTNSGSIRRYFIAKFLHSNPSELLNLRPRMKITELFQGANVGKESPIRTIVAVKRGSVLEPRIEKSDPEKVAGILAAELFWEFEAGHWRHNQYLLSPSAACGRDFLQEEQEHRSKVKEVLNSATKQSNNYILKVPYEINTSKVAGLIERIFDNEV